MFCFTEQRDQEQRKELEEQVSGTCLGRGRFIFSLLYSAVQYSTVQSEGMAVALSNMPAVNGTFVVRYRLA